MFTYEQATPGLDVSGPPLVSSAEDPAAASLLELQQQAGNSGVAASFAEGGPLASYAPPMTPVDAPPPMSPVDGPMQFPRIPGETGFTAEGEIANAGATSAVETGATAVETGALGEGTVMAGGTALGEGSVVAGSGVTLTGGTVVAEGAVVVGETAMLEGTVLTGATAAAETAAVLGGPVVWIAIGTILLVGGITYWVVRQAEPAQAPGAPNARPAVDPGSPEPVTEPADGTAPMSEPTPATPASLPGPSSPEPLFASSPEVEDMLRRLDRLVESGEGPTDADELRARLGAADPQTRDEAAAELVRLEQIAQAFQQNQDQDATQSVPFTAESAFDELMNRRTPPLNGTPYNRWPRTRYRINTLQPEDLSTIPGEQKQILVITAPNGDTLRFSVVWRDGVFEDIHQSSGGSRRQR